MCSIGLTFGARAGDLAEVKRLGVEKWIDLLSGPSSASS